MKALIFVAFPLWAGCGIGAWWRIYTGIGDNLDWYALGVCLLGLGIVNLLLRSEERRGTICE